MAETTGSAVLTKSLAAAGIKKVFGVPAPGLEGVLEALEAGGLTVVLAVDETAACAMADGYIRRSLCQAAVISAGHGRCLSQVSGVTNAWADKIPLLSLALCEDTEPDENPGIRRDLFDQTAVFKAVTVFRKRVADAGELPGLVEKALSIAASIPMGPAHLDLPRRMMEAEAPEGAAEGLVPAKEERALAPPRLPADRTSLSRAVDLLKQAKRPLVFAGGGVRLSGASEALTALVEEWGLPVATSMAGMGAVGKSHPNCLGPPSYTAGEAFHHAIALADVVLALGVGFSGLEGFGLPPLWSPDIRFIHVDTDVAQLGFNVSPAAPVCADVATFLDQLKSELSSGFSPPASWGKWLKSLQAKKASRRARADKDASHPWDTLHQGRMVRELSNLLEKEDALVVIDGGNTPLYAAIYGPDLKPGQSFFPFGMAALGLGVPYAIGVSLAAPDKRVALLTGDGSFLYNVQELETIRRLNLPIAVMVNNDSAWNMIKALQLSFYERRYVGTCLPDVDYAKVAEGFGWGAERVDKAEDIQPAMERALAHGGQYLIDFLTDSRNAPDSLLSFALVEFEGSLTDFSPLSAVKSQWKNRDLGKERAALQTEYVKKALAAPWLAGKISRLWEKGRGK
ncbi:MAG: thiamine pyrophosphate-binding protein [Deltaproteobacteria bacterium]|nr:thiamine pyrophosphate-binding protein [Deltaproteobacteria bacterium]